MILILSDKNDIHADQLIEKLEKKNVKHIRLDLDVQSLLKTKVKYSEEVWIFQLPDEIQFNSKQISCVWMRRAYVELLVEENYKQEIGFKIWKNEWNRVLLGFYTTIRNIPWLNYYRDAFKAENKVLQLDIAKSIGFSCPQTLITNDKAELEIFADKFKDIALKLMHQDIYKIEEDNFKGIYTNKINKDDLNQFKEEEENPILVQNYIEKDFEVRYTYVDGKHLVCKIESQKSEQTSIDWRRYDIPNTPHLTIEASKEIKNKVNRFMKELNLNYGALDFIVDKFGNWLFLEVNSMGQYLWIEELTDLKISDTIVEWLAKNTN